MEKLEKIIALHRLLSQSRYCVPLETILDRIECSVATFHRIRTFMRSRLNAPIVFSRRYRGYHYDLEEGETFHLPGLWLSRVEIEALLSIEQAVGELSKGVFEDFFRPITTTCKKLLTSQNVKPARFHEQIKIIPTQSLDIDAAVFDTVAHAVIHRTCIQIAHTPGYSRTPITRRVSPQVLIRYRDNWYLDAFCHLRNQLRSFAVHRISSVKKAAGDYREVPPKLRDEFFGATYGIFNGPVKQHAQILFYQNAARQVSLEKWHPDQKGEWLDEKTFKLTLPYGKEQELIMDVLRWGADAQIIAPGELRKKAGEIVRRMGQRYGAEKE